MILVGVLVVVSGAFTAAQTAQSPVRRQAVIARSTTGATVEFDQGEMRQGAVYVQNLTIMIRDLVVTADDAALEGTEVKLGNNARVTLPATESTEYPSYLIPVSTTRYTIPLSMTGATVQFNGRAWPENVTNVQNVILTVGDLVIRADDATVDKTEIKLGANARLVLPTGR